MTQRSSLGRAPPRSRRRSPPGEASALDVDRRRAGAHRGAQSGAQCLHRRRPPSARARKARAIDASRDKAKLPLAGVPFAVKNLFDIAGLATVAGSKINRARPPATRDSPLIERLEAAGAVLVGALNMGEYAYDFTGENVHDGPSRNPHDMTRMTGGSSGGSGGAVAGGLVPLALGSDTNGSIRVPSSFCGIFGLKPTYGRLTRARTFPFVASLDHLGPFARTTRDLALSYDAMQGPDADDPACATDRPSRRRRSSAAALSGLRIAVAGGYFRQGAFPEALEALARVAKAPDAAMRSKFPKRRARAPRLTSSPRPKARRCISTACATKRTISIRRCATA